MRLPTLMACVLMTSAPLHAEVVEVADGGFAVRHSTTVAATPEAVWQAMMYRIEDWWHPDHSWSADASNLYIDARLGGCFCERLPASGGAVEHLRIVFFEPERTVRLNGALGPLVDLSVDGRMTWRIDPVEDGSTVTFTYRVFGVMEGGFEGLAPVVDSVIGQQHQRLANLLQDS
ncbi:SRPBCC family protein [Elongatibacter sediminis]|uniref:SRPBCC family protein n=1 Tax=Elongatibacter sediminis TaxID=3119006 RepID=A0AAW9RKH0_9GAMM